jgi:integrase
LVYAKPQDDHYLFKSRKGKNYPLTTYAVTMMVQRWCDEINLSGNYGAHTLRKTWCYHQRKTFGVSWELLAKRLNHSSPSITRRYLGVQEEEVEEILMHTI